VRQLEHGQIIATIGHPRTPAPGNGTAAHELKPLPLPPADDDFDRPTSPRVRFQELAQVWVITYSLLLDPWNDLPLHLRDSEHTVLKTHLFC